MTLQEQQAFIIEARERLKGGCESYESVAAIARDALSVIAAQQERIAKLDALTCGLQEEIVEKDTEIEHLLPTAEQWWIRGQTCMVLGVSLNITLYKSPNEVGGTKP